MNDIVLVALISSGASVFVVIIATLWQNRKLDTIRVLVNSQLQKALDRISELEASIRELRSKGPKSI